MSTRCSRAIVFAVLAVVLPPAGCTYPAVPRPPRASVAPAAPKQTTATPTSRPAPRPPRAWNGDAFEPRLEYARRHSPPHYERFASRSLYIEGLAAQIARATLPTKLHAVEIDFFDDDDYYRDGELVMLDVDAGVATAFASRCYVDIQYPTPKLHQDGFGGTEWGASSLTLIRDRVQRTKALRLTATDSRPSMIKSGTAHYRTFQDNDAVLLYFNPQDLAAVAPGGVDTMRLEDADAEVERIVRDSTNIFGQEYVLLSKTCFKELKDAVPEQDIATDLLLSVSGRFFGMALNRFVFRPLFKTGADQLGKFLGKQAGRVFAHTVSDMVDGLERRDLRVERKRLAVRTLQGYRPNTRGVGVRAIALPETRSLLPTRGEAPTNSLPLAPRDGVLGVMSVLGTTNARSPSPMHVQLLGVELPPPGTEERTALDDYLRQMLRGRPAEFIRFNPSPRAAQRGLLLVPDEQVVLNYELVRQGLARFDASDPNVAITFPELVTAAKQALDAGTGFASRWRGDQAYRDTLKPPPDIWGGLGNREATHRPSRPGQNVGSGLKGVRPSRPPRRSQ